MPVPEAAINKYGCVIFWQNDIGFSRKIFIVKFKPEPLSMQKAANNNFRFCVGASDAAHHAASGALVYNIHQQSKPAVIFAPFFPVPAMRVYGEQEDVQLLL